MRNLKLIKTCLFNYITWYIKDVQSARFPRSYKLNEKSLQHYIAHLEIQLVFNTIPKHLYTAVWFWHEFKNSIQVRVRFLHSQPIMNHFHFIATVKSATSQSAGPVAQVHSSWFYSRSKRAQPLLIAYQELNFFCNKIFKPMPWWDKCIKLLRDYAEKQWYFFSGINYVHIAP